MRLTVKGLAGVGAVLVALLLTSVATQAKALLDVNLASQGTATRFVGEKLPTDRGPGWRSSSTEDGRPDFDAISYKLAPGRDIDPARGSIDVAVQRSREGGPEWDGGSTYNTLFSILDRDGRRLLVAYILWEFRGNHAISGVVVDSDIPAVREGLWGTMVPFDRKVSLGEWVDLKFSWGAGNTRILVNGVEVPAYYRDYDGVANKPVVPIVPGAAFDASAYLKDAAEIVIGSDVDYDSDNRKSGRTGSFGLYNSVLGKFVITDGDAAVAGPAIASVEHNAARIAGFSGALVAGNDLAVEMQGTPGAAASFDVVHVTDLSRSIALDWRGFGVYLEQKSFFEPGEVDLRDVSGYQVFVGKEPINPAAPGIAPVARLDVKEQSYTVESLDVDAAYYVAVLAEMRDGTFRTVVATPTNVAMTESAPGVYAGSYKIGWGDRFAKAAVVGRLGAGADASTLVGGATFAVDPSLNVSVVTSPSELKADETSTAKVTVTVTDRNGNPVPGHKVKYLLATTSQYTGVVGGGAFSEQVGGSLQEATWGETDLFGRVTATYVAGFAAKTAVIVARDMLSNSTGSGYVKTFIQATAQILLEPETSPAADTGYAIAVSSSDEWLTADGQSQARITAKVTLNGQPVEGHNVAFDVSSGTGSVRAVQGTTDRNGVARAIYTAGTKIGVVMVRATDTVVGISAGVQIELRSDAPAKIAVTVTPEKLVADGRSTAELLVLVTDINDNPNENTEVEYDLVSGGGRIRDAKGVTDRNGESLNEYTAGRSPGAVSIEITVRSTVPTEAELAKARELAVAVTDYDFF